MSYAAASKYRGKGEYHHLVDSEKAHWNEYTNLRMISDWPGFDSDQEARLNASRRWLNERIDLLVALAAGRGPAGSKPGWNRNNRGLRYDFLKGMASGRPAKQVKLPCPGGATNRERAYIEEREVYLAIAATTADQKARKARNLEKLIRIRTGLWHLGTDHGWSKLDRSSRYDALCVATSYGDAYTRWAKTHDKYGEPIKKHDHKPPSDTNSSQRDRICNWLDRQVGIHENPQGSNTGHPEPSGWQHRVYGGDGVPWCACFAVCSAWDNGISGSGTASVGLNTELAREGRGIYKGFTTDPSKVRPGDHCFNYGNHTGVARTHMTPDGYIVTVEGNTSGSTSSGSQWNGDVVAKKSRHHSYWTGFGLVRTND